MRNEPFLYRIVSPLYYTYNGIEANPDTSHFYFNLLDNGTVTVDDGNSLNYWGLMAYFNSISYGDYCFVANYGNTYDVNFLLRKFNSLYVGGRFVFTWNRD